jgi:hypothetical protein
MTAPTRRQVDLAISEADWQRTVLDLAYAFHWLAYHTFDSRRSQPGFPDLVLVRDRVVFAELKTERGKPTSSQNLWVGKLVRAGAEVHVWRPSDWPDVVLALRARRP